MDPCGSRETRWRLWTFESTTLLPRWCWIHLEAEPVELVQHTDVSPLIQEASSLLLMVEGGGPARVGPAGIGPAVQWLWLKAAGWSITQRC